MKKSYYSAILFAAALLGFSACSSDELEIPDPDTSVVAIVGGYTDTHPRMTGPSSIELDGLYTFTAQSDLANDTFTFSIEDTYFNDPKSFGYNVSVSGTRLNVVFNDYGRFVIYATSKITGQSCSYEVAKYYRNLNQLKYCSNTQLENGPSLSTRQVQWFERYTTCNTTTLDFIGKITNYQQRIVIKVNEMYHTLCYPLNAPAYIKPAGGGREIIGTAAKGDSQISLPSGKIIRDPKFNITTWDNINYTVPYCMHRTYTIPAERCGAL